MFEKIRNYEKVTSKLDPNYSWYRQEIMRVEFQIEESVFNDRKKILYLDLKVVSRGSKQVYLEKLKFIDVNDLSLKSINNIPLGDRLIIQDMKEKPMDWPLDMRYHVHDDSGYGENDGYRYINFYCGGIEALSIDEYPYSEEF